MTKENYVRPAILKDALELAPRMKAKTDLQRLEHLTTASPLQALVFPFTEPNGKVIAIIGTNR